MAQLSSSAIWLGVDIKTNTKKHVLEEEKKIELHAQNMLTILESMAHKIWERRPKWPLNMNENLLLKQWIRYSDEIWNSKANRYGDDLALAIISH